VDPKPIIIIIIFSFIIILLLLLLAPLQSLKKDETETNNFD